MTKSPIKIENSIISKIEPEGINVYLLVHDDLYFQLVEFNFEDIVNANFKVDVSDAEYVWQMLSNKKVSKSRFEQVFDIFKFIWPNDEIFVSAADYDFVLSENKKSSTVAFAYSIK